MKVIATAKIIAASTRVFLLLPLATPAVVLLTAILSRCCLLTCQILRGYPGPAAGTLGRMSVWQYAQLTITWHGPEGEVDDNFAGNQLTILQLLNQVGADGWELTSQEEHRPQSDDRSYWDAAWTLATYTFKRRVSDLASRARRRSRR